MKVLEFPRAMRTVRHLRWSQIVARLNRISRHRLPLISAVWARPEWVVVPDCASHLDLPFVPLASHTEPDTESLIASLRAGDFHHLNQTETVGRVLPNWRLGVQSRSRLWTVTLHYHFWAHQLAQIVHGRGPRATEAEILLVDYLSDWISRCDLSVSGTEDLAWNSYAIATRIPVWIRVYYLLKEECFSDHPDFRDRFLSSLYRQAISLAANLEWDLRANHLLRDAVGLAWAGRFFRGRQAQQWLQTATRLASEQVREQVLPDGGHFEQSAHYHLEAMRDFLALAALIPDAEIAQQLRSVCRSMFEFARWMQHPDGASTQFNDSSRVPSAEITRLGESLGLILDDRCRPGGRYFADTGIVAWHGARWTMFFDVGDVGPRCQPAHAHADTLTVECSVNGRRLFVDPGCHSYDQDDRRRYDRSTAAHNTVCVDGIDSSEVWHIFRVGRRACPQDVRVEITENGIHARASHDGYESLAGSPRHSRQVTAGTGREILIEDRIAGHGHHSVTGGYLLAPEWSAEIGPAGWVVYRNANRVQVDIQSDREIELSVQRRPVHSEYGLEAESNRLCWSYAGPLPIRVTTKVDLLELSGNAEEEELKEKSDADPLSEP